MVTLKTGAGVALVVAAGLVGGLLVAAHAEDRPGRFTMTPVEGGFMRLDTETGATSLCKSRDSACTVLPDSETTLRGEIDRLKDENAKLKAENKGLQDMVAMGAGKPGEDGKPGDGKLNLPSEHDVDKAFDYVESLVKKFRERMKRLDKEGKDTPL
jgi:hypothetical protein